MEVLLGIDGTDESFAALREALARAREAGDALTVAVVDREDVALSPEESEAQVRDVLSETDVAAEVIRLAGDPGSRLVELTEREAFDRLVVPGGRRSPLGKINFDESLEFVLLNAETTVTLVR